MLLRVFFLLKSLSLHPPREGIIIFMYSFGQRERRRGRAAFCCEMTGRAVPLRVRGVRSRRCFLGGDIS